MELPFLYQTRTIMRVRPRCRLRLSTRGTRQQSTATTNPLLNDTDQVSFFRQKAQEVAAKVSQQIPQHFTQQEQAAFNSLRRLAGQRELQARLGITPEPERLDINPDNILALYTPQTHSEPPSTDPEGEPDTSTESTARQARAAEIERVVHEICRSQLHSLATTFRSALQSTTQPGDLALWEVLETRVFPLLKLLKSSHTPPQPCPTQPSTKHHTTAVAASAAIAAEKATATKLLPLSTLVAQHATNNHSIRSVPPLKVLSRYYPAALLLALRLLIKHHPLSLHTHRLLPHLRTLGPSSYILGATAPFYSTHLLLRWHVYSSLREVCDTLSEMERSAVDFDRGTHRFLTDLADERGYDLALVSGDEQSPSQSLSWEGATNNKALDNEPDPTPRAREPGWWLEPEQQRWWAEVEEWRAKVSRALEERGMGVVRREGPGAGNAGGGAAGGRRDTPFEGVKPQVWL